VRRLDVEVRRQERLEHAPLVEPQTVHDDEDRGALALQDGEEELAHHVDRERWTIAVEIREPFGIRRSRVLRELAVHVGVQPLQRVVQAALVGLGEIDVPAHQLVVALDPAAPVEVPVALELQRAEALDEAARDRLRADPRTVEDLRDDREHLARIHRLHQVVAHVRADRLAQRRVLVALGDHDDRDVGRDVAHLAVRLESAFPRHLLVEQEDVERAATQQLHGVVGVGGALDVVALGAEEDPVRLEQIALVVHPEDGFGARRHTKLKVPGERPGQVFKVAAPVRET
jgi:hypothetical protein